MSKSTLSKATADSVLSFRESVRDGGLKQLEVAKANGIILPADMTSRPIAPYGAGRIAKALSDVSIAQPRGEWFWTTKRAKATYTARIPVFLTGAKETREGQKTRGYFLGNRLLTKFGVEDAFAFTTLAGGFPSDLQGYTRAGDMGASKTRAWYHTATTTSGIDVAFINEGENANVHSAKFEKGIVEMVCFIAETYLHNHKFDNAMGTPAKVDMATWGDVDNVVRVKWYNEGKAPAKVVKDFAAFSPTDASSEAFAAFLIA